ncbi:cytochrome [Sesamum alatum]|uniref:Cytochrome n=1 Tax=Sesamum alatum TaxID=300844 RepID=A0AAE1XXB6_9LAMI|nr:cytochrome [Sesamum alatum]
MEWHFFVYPAIILLPALIFATIYSKRSGRDRLPPGPPGWPVFGHMFNLGGTPHRTIAELEPKYGPVVWLKLGSINTMAVLTAKAASEFFKNHDLSFADRAIVETMTAHGYHYGSLALAPYGSRWRVLRRICTVEMFVGKRINETGGIRRKCVDDMLSWIEKDGNGNVIPVGRYVFLASFNMLGNLMMSRDLVDPESEKGMEFYEAMKRLMEWSGRPNVSDLFPWIRWIDLQGLKRRANRDMGIAMGIASGFVKERIQQRKNGEGKEDFLDVLLEFEGCKGDSEKLTETEIIIFILVSVSWIKN